MSEQPAPIMTRATKCAGCFVAVVVLVSILGLLISAVYYSERVNRERRERDEKQRRSESFAEVKSGHNDVSIHEPLLLTMLANDVDCVENLESIYFFMVDLTDSRYGQVKKLTNVNQIGFYDCHGAGNVLKSVSGMPSIETLFFESIDLDDTTLESLAAIPNLKKVQFEQILNQHQIEVLAREIPNVKVEGVDPITEEPISIQDGKP